MASTQPLSFEQAPCHDQQGRAKTLRDELVAEAFGSLMIIMLGNGVVATWGVGDFRYAYYDPFAKSVFTNVSWAIGVTFGVMVSFNASGGYLNPALTLNAMLNHGFPFRKGLQYMAAQTFGFFLGAVLITFNFVVFKKEPRLWNFYTTGPGADVSFFNAGLNEFFGTAILSICVAAITSNKPAFDKFHVAGFVGLSIFGIGNVFGSQSGYALNPGRDAGPRLCLWMFSIIYGQGYFWGDVMQDGYFIVPIVAPMLGAVAGGFVYKRLIFQEAPIIS